MKLLTAKHLWAMCLAVICLGAHRAEAAAGDIYAANFNTNTVSYYSPDGVFKGLFVAPNSGGLNRPTGLAFTPSGDLLVASSASNQILRYDGDTGDFLGEFASAANPFSMTFGPDQNLYVSLGTGTQVVKLDGTTGAFLGFGANGGGLGGPIGVGFGPDDNLYVASSGTNQVLKYDPSTGNSLGVFASGNGLTVPLDIQFGPDGLGYVSDVHGNVYRYASADGSFVDTHSVLPDIGFGAVPVGLAFGLDGTLYAGDFGNDKLYRINPDGTTDFLTGDGLGGPENIIVKPVPGPSSVVPLGLAWTAFGMRRRRH